MTTLVTDSVIESLLDAALGIDAWLDTMRHHTGDLRGYTGPVVHWWQNCFQYTGVGLDWRYEGIIMGYLALFRTTGNTRWLEKARCAGDDLVDGQLRGGTFYHSAFELNPHTGGTPHEAAVDNGLLALASILREMNDGDWERYLETARRNLEGFYIAQLWDEDARLFFDQPNVPSFVPNKSATLCEALFSLAQITGDERYVTNYALPTLDTVVAHQITDGSLSGGIWQNRLGNTVVQKIFPYYVARCIPALLKAYVWTEAQGKPQALYLDAALSAGRFLKDQQREDGSFPQVVYANGSVNLYPQWVAAVGDVLRSWRMLERFGFDTEIELTQNWMLSGQCPTGGMMTARGFGSQISQRRPAAVPDFRDFIACCGWVDKAFRYLAESTQLVGGSISPDSTSKSTYFEQECDLRGRRAMFYEDENRIEVRDSKTIFYRWNKGSQWAEICDPLLYWK